MTITGLPLGSMAAAFITRIWWLKVLETSALTMTINAVAMGKNLHTMESKL